MKKIIVIASSITIGLLILVLIGLIISGSLFKWGPFNKLFDMRVESLQGNNEIYSCEKIEKNENSPLKDKHIAFLGSSITAGYASLNESFADFLSAKDGVISYKEAVNGTTLADINSSSYVSRLSNFPKDLPLDLFILQLSTNDANGAPKIGEIDSADKKTTFGAINHIVDYVKETYNCKVLLFSNPKYNNATYKEMVEKANELDNLNDNLYFLDLYNNKKFNNITKEEWDLYMFDNIHPTRAGYSVWWLPEFEKAIEDVLNKQN